MMKILLMILIILFFYNKQIVSANIIEAINIWYKNLFPSIFPTLVLCDLLVSYNEFDILVNTLGKLFTRIFNISKYGIIVLVISILCGTPSNMVLAKLLYDHGLLTKEDINKLIPLCLFFNPLFVINFANFRCFIIIIVASLLTGLIFRNMNPKTIDNEGTYNIKFNLNNSISKNMQIIINILGTVAIFMVLANIIVIKKPIVSCILAGIFEITTGLYKVSLFFPQNDILYLLFLSLGGISIFIQITSVLKELHLNYKLIFLQRLLCYLISVCICILT